MQGTRADELLVAGPRLGTSENAILGYGVSIRTECPADTIKSAIKSAMSLWQARSMMALMKPTSSTFELLAMAAASVTRPHPKSSSPSLTTSSERYMRTSQAGGLLLGFFKPIGEDTRYTLTTHSWYVG